MRREKVLEARVAHLELRLAVASENCQEAWLALQMIRHAIEELGPPGVLASVEQTQASYLSEAEALVHGIKKIAESPVAHIAHSPLIVP